MLSSTTDRSFPLSQPPSQMPAQETSAQKYSRPSATSLHPEVTSKLARRAVESVTPLWSLERFVAVNPLQGATAVPFAQAVADFAESHEAQILPSFEHFKEAFRSGAFDEKDVLQAIAPAQPPDGTMVSLSLTRVMQKLTDAHTSDQNDSISKNAGDCRQTEIEEHQAARSWITEQNAKWLSALLWENGSAWQVPSARQDLISNWKRFANGDHSFDVAGWGQLRASLCTLPDTCTDLLNLLSMECVDNWFEPSPENLNRFFARLVATNHGWMAFARFLDHEAGWAQDQGFAYQVLGIQVATELALLRSGLPSPLWQKLARPQPERQTNILNPIDPGTTERLALLEAFESGLRRRFLGHVLSTERSPSPERHEESAERFRMVFCIDPRSERLRRHAERIQGNVRTTGFAGFFALPIAHGSTQQTARCPVLLKPTLGFRFRSQPHPSHSGAAFKSIKKSLSTAFSFVEAAGLFYAHALVRDAFFPNGAGQKTRAEDQNKTAPQGQLLELATGTPVELNARIALACNFLRHSGLGHCQARVVLLCGHGSSTDNNAHGTALDCGACGGHKGDVNAIAAAALLNDPDVRSGVAARGFSLSPDAVFWAGLHNTTTGTVTVFTEENLSEEDQTLLKELRLILDKATELSLNERRGAEDWGATSNNRTASREAQLRAASIGEVRPEWGLARNAFFIAAPRTRTMGLDLDGRAFLHDYDHKSDGHSETLELILTAPLLVAHGINMQYYTSTVDNPHFGSGSKLLHSVVGNFGVFEGTSHELRTGLPVQSVHDGNRAYHDPVRLQVFIEAPTVSIDHILRKHQHVSDLVANRWLTLFALCADNDDSVTRVQRCIEPGKWRSEAL